MAFIRRVSGQTYTYMNGKWHHGKPETVRARLLAERVAALESAAPPPEPYTPSARPPLEPPPGVTVPTTSFRWKAGRLQQLHSHPGGGHTRWWIDVPTVSDDAPDVI